MTLEYIKDPDDKTLERMAKEAEGRDLVSLKCDWYAMRLKKEGGEC